MKPRSSFATIVLFALLVVSPVAAQQASTAEMLAPRLTSQHEVLSRTISLRLDDVTVEEALDRIVSAAKVEISYSRDVVALNRRVSLRLKEASVRDALSQVLAGQNLKLMVGPSGQIVLAEENGAKAEPQTGAIGGRVTDAGSGTGVSGASVLIEGTDLGAVTGNTGRYRIADVPAGTYRVVVQQFGYAEAGQTVAVSDDSETTADFVLAVTALPLDEIVATSTAFATKIRTLPNPITVITAREIERKGATNISDLLRGEIPGVVPITFGNRSTFSYIYARGNAGGSTQDLMKIYVDGIEMASAFYITQINPKNIERIEVVRGPQASTIYGSGAASGVLQIFTKKGRPGLPRPQVDVQVSVGLMESEFTPSDVSTPLTHDHSLNLTGGGEDFSYRVGGSYVKEGEWVNDFRSTKAGLSGGLRATHGPITVEFSTSWSTMDHRSGPSPAYLTFPAGACTQCGNPDYVDNLEWTLSHGTTGLSLNYQATSSWLHTLVLGDDQMQGYYHQPEPSYNAPADTFVRFSDADWRRRSVRYHTAYSAEFDNGVTARLTGGAEYWNYDLRASSIEDLTNAVSPVLRNSATNLSSFNNDAWWNAGYFGMAELGFQDRLFGTVALRVEENPNLGENFGRAVSPRLGLSYVHDLGPAELKLRGQWGKGVRPPQPNARAGVVQFGFIYLPNPDIAPEEKAGWDAGFDLFWGNRASLSVTRYDEEATNLINQVDIDPTATPATRQYQNIGVVDIEGWEVEGELQLGRITIAGNYAYSNNVIRKVTDAVAANPNAPFRAGDRTTGMPTHSGGGRVTARVADGSVTLDASGRSGWRYLDFITYYGYVYLGDEYRGSIRDYYIEYPAVWRWNLYGEQAVTEKLTAFMRVNNLLDNQEGEYSNFDVARGRTTTLGVRWTF